MKLKGLMCEHTEQVIHDPPIIRSELILGTDEHKLAGHSAIFVGNVRYSVRKKLI
jgi:hypothetical protein